MKDKINSRRKVVLSALCMILWLYSTAQDFNQVGKNIVPPSPDAAALGKYGDIPVNLYTGTPNIQIPLYSIQSGNIGLALSLSYHSLIKVEESSSWVGSGWTMNAGGVITRTVRGLPDESDFGYLNTGSKVRNWDSNLNKEDSVFLFNIIGNFEDGEPDVFNFNFAGYSGKFVLDETGAPHVIPFQNMKVEYNILSDEIDNFTVTLPNGFKYKFGNQQEDAREKTRTVTGSNNSPSVSQAVTSWYLTQITAPGRSDDITFHYKDGGNLELNINQSETKYLLRQFEEQVCQGTNELRGGISFSQNTVLNQKILDRIDFTNGYVRFYADEFRDDLIGARRLEKVAIFDINDNLIRAFELRQSYAGGRMYLDEVQEKTGDMAKPAYQFDYFNKNLPFGDSFAVDHWGFYNGKTSNKTYIPRYLEGQVYHGTGADREPSASRGTNGVLQQITYPTGGRTEFVFEPHDYSFISQANETGGNVEKIDFLPSLQSRASYQGNETNIETLTIDHSQTVRLSVEANLDLGVNDTPNDPATAKVVLRKQGTLEVIAERFYDYATVGNGPNPGVLSDAINISINDPGQYELVASFQNFGQSEISGTLTYKTKNIADKQTTGGIRIQKIINYDDYGNIANTKNYTYTLEQGNTTLSSGVLMRRINYNSDFLHVVAEYDCFSNIPGTLVGSEYECGYEVLYSSNVSQLGATRGNHIGYKKVTVSTGDATVGYNGREENTFTYFPDVNGVQGAKSVLSAPLISYDWRRGNLLRQDIFDADDKPVKSIINHYSDKNANTVEVLMASFYKRSQCFGDEPAMEETRNIYNWYQYSMISEWFYLDQTEEITYNQDNPNEFVSNVTTFEYDDPDHMLVTRSNTTTSEGDVIGAVIKYPFQFTEPHLQSMTNRHLLDYQIEKQVWQNDKLSMSEIMNYENDRPAVYYKFESDVLVDNLADNTDNLLADGRYEPRSSFQYTTGGELELNETDGFETTFLWDEHDQVIAEIQNAAPENVFHTSFESDETNISYESKTGSKSHIGSYLIPDLPDDAGDYWLSYWTYESDQWTFNKSQITLPTASIQIGQGNVPLDEVRIYPVQARMTTFTYELMKGLITATDVNDITTCYQYDCFGRLVSTKDHEGNLLQYHDYHYKYATPEEEAGLCFDLDFTFVSGAGTVNFTPTFSHVKGSTYLWEFGDGQTSTAYNPTVNLTGFPLLVRLTVTRNAISKTIEKTIDIDLPPLSVDIALSKTDILEFDDITATANVTGGTGAYSRYEWWVNNQNPTEASNTFLFTAFSNTSTINVRVYDSFGNTAEASVPIDVQAFGLIFTAGSCALKGETYLIEWNRNGEPEDNVNIKLLKDGAFIEDIGDELSLHISPLSWAIPLQSTLPVGGGYEILVELKSNTNIRVKSAPFEIKNALNASISFNTPIIKSSDIVTATASVSGGSGQYDIYEWWINDSPINIGDDTFTFTAAPGTNQVLLKVQDSEGQRATATRSFDAAFIDVDFPPMGTTTLTAGQSYPVGWTFGGVSAEPGTKIKLELLKSSTVVNTVEVSLSSQAFNWTVPTSSGGTGYTLRISLKDDPTLFDVSDPFEVIDPFVVSMALNKSTILEFDEVIATATPSGGSGTYTQYEWWVNNQSPITGTANYQFTAFSNNTSVSVRVYDSQGRTATATRTFNVESLNMIFSSDGGHVIKGESYNIEWSRNGGAEDDVNIKLLKDGVFVQDIADRFSLHTSPFTWSIPASSTLALGSNYQVLIELRSNTEVFVKSNPFEISDPMSVSLSLNPSRIKPFVPVTATASVSGGSGTISTYEWWTNNTPVTTGGSTFTFTPDLNTTEVNVKVYDANGRTVTRKRIFELTYIDVDFPPAGTTILTRGQTYPINWTYSGIDDDPSNKVDLRLYKSGTLVQSLSVAIASGGYSWTVPSSIGTGSNFKWRVSLQGDNTIFDESNAFQVITPLSASISLNKSTILDGDAVRATASVSGGSGSYTTYEWRTNASGWTSGTSSTFDFTAFNNSSPVTLRVTDSYGTTVTATRSFSVNDFNISFFPPNGEAEHGETYPIDWSLNGVAVDNVNIKLMRNGNFVADIADRFSLHVPPFNWTVSSSLATQAGYKVRIEDRSNTAVFVESFPFEIKTPSSGGGGGGNWTLNLTVDNARNVTANVSGCSTSKTYKWYRRNGGSWTLISGESNRTLATPTGVTEVRAEVTACGATKTEEIDVPPVIGDGFN
ncbi:MAG: Ser-Thr-rich GPI-anchored membrane family protein [Bacteroidota bacterium]